MNQSNQVLELPASSLHPVGHEERRREEDLLLIALERLERQLGERLSRGGTSGKTQQELTGIVLEQRECGLMRSVLGEK